MQISKTELHEAMISIKQEPGEQTQRREPDPQAPREANTAEVRGIGRDSKGRRDPTWGQRRGHWRETEDVEGRTAALTFAI